MRPPPRTHGSAEDAARPERGESRAAAATGLGNAATASLLGGPGLWRQAASPGGGGPLDPRLEAAIAAQRGSGAAIPEADRAGLEQHLGFDFSAVRVHTGPEADALSGAVQADAFTVGTDVFFRSGRYDPAGQAGRQLLAHELSHVVQQTTGTAGGTGGISEPTDDAEVRAGQAARAYLAGEAGSAYQPGGGAPPGILQVMRHAGNRAVGAYLQRQHHPAPAAGTTPVSPPVPVSAPTADENAPVELPREGDLRVVFSSGRQMGFELNDLSEFGIGEGKLETPPIPVGEFITVSAAIGSHNPITLIQPALTLDPVIGSISAAEVAKNRAAEAGSAETRTTIGAVAAGAGGIIGGLAGMAGGGIAGATAGTLLGPLGAAAGGLAGAGIGAKRGAQAGGQIAGGVSDSLYDLFHGDFQVTARLDQGRITGSIGLHYTPFLRLTLAATGFDWLASISAELQTAMNLTAKASIALSGSDVVLHFNGGRLVRTVFTLTPSASLDLSLSAEARLKLTGSLLNILEESAGRDQALLSGEFTTASFSLFEIGGTIGAQTAFTFAKGSPMDILSRNVRAAEGATRERFIAGLRVGGPSIPLLKKRGALDDKSRTGLSQGDAILMAWHKPADWYPDYLTRPSADGRGEKIAKFPHKTYDNGLAMGVDYWPHEGMKLQYRGGEEPRGSGVARFLAELREEGIELDRDLAYQADIDHVVDWAFNGADDATNLWPLERGANRSAGTTQNRFQKVWWAADKGQQPRYTAIEEVPAGRWFEIESLRSPGGKHG